jgi:RNA polymerase sigma factor (sigma-70 family)
MTATEPAARDIAWDEFLALHSRLLLHVARKVMPTAEGAMDAYANLLERLRRDNCRALAGYTPDGRSRFTTWLVVVARRMCVDFYRQQYGRPRNEEPSDLALIEREARRRLINFVGIDDALAQIVDYRHEDPEECVRQEQLRHALDRVVSALSPDDKLLLKLRFYDALSANEIATVLKFPTPFHVYRRLKTVCADLRRNLVAAGVEDSAP